MSCSVVIISDRPWRWRDVIHRSELLRLPQTLSETRLLFSQVVHEHNNVLRRRDKLLLMTSNTSCLMSSAGRLLAIFHLIPLPLLSSTSRSLACNVLLHPMEPKATSVSLTSIVWLAPPKLPRLSCIQRRRRVPQNLVRTERAVRLILEAHHQLSHQCCPNICSRCPWSRTW
jgi:hypothetical protein